MPTYVLSSNYLNSPEVTPVHQEIAEFCIPSVVGQVNPACDPDLAFILSLEFFGQVYRKFLISNMLMVFLKMIYLYSLWLQSHWYTTDY